ncbi:MAG: HAMP domain-containing sensor histidine kinase [Pseudomonadota bacterium]
MPAVNFIKRLLRPNTIVVGLVTVPLILITVLAIRTIIADKAASLARAGETAQQVAKSYAVQLDSAVNQIASNRLNSVAEPLSIASDPLTFLRRIVYERSPPFVFLVEADVRIFPPQENASAFTQELKILARLESALAATREKATAQVKGFTWARLFGFPVLLTCGQLGADRVLCIVSPLSDIQPTIDKLLSNTTADQGPPVELVDPWGQRQWPREQLATVEERTASIELVEALAGWKIRVGVDTDTGDASLLISAIVIPVTVGWGLALIALVRYQSGVTRQHRARAESAARLSHDLRTPIANMAIYVELIGRHGMGNPKIARCCEALEVETARLAFIAESTLRRSRGLPQQADDGPLVDADKVITSILSRYEPLMAKSGCKITFEADGSAAMVNDRTALERILINLIDNARSHAEGANVQVATKKIDDQIVLTISDDGSRFSQNGHKQTSNHGLGLKVVEELARSKGGTFKAFINSAGSRFEVALPSVGGLKS